MGSIVRCQGKENKGLWSRMLNFFVGDFTEIQIEGSDFFTTTPQNQKIKNCFAGGHFFLPAFIYRWFVSVHRDISCSVEVNVNFASEHRKKHVTSVSDNWCHQCSRAVLPLLQKSHFVFYSRCLMPPSWHFTVPVTQGDVACEFREVTHWKSVWNQYPWGNKSWRQLNRGGHINITI